MARHLREWRAEIHKRLALPAACLVFALLGVGFGITHVRTGRSFGLLLGLAIPLWAKSGSYWKAAWSRSSSVETAPIVRPQSSTFAITKAHPTSIFSPHPALPFVPKRAGASFLAASIARSGWAQILE